MHQEPTSRGVLGKRCSENILRQGCSPVNLLHIFRTTFPKDTPKRLLLDALRVLLDIYNAVFTRIANCSTAWKVFVFRIILVRIFPHLNWIRRYLYIQSQCGKRPTRITPNTDTFDALLKAWYSFHKKINLRYLA